MRCSGYRYVHGERRHEGRCVKFNGLLLVAGVLVQVDDLNDKDQNDVIKDLSSMSDSEYNQIFIDIKGAYDKFDLERAKLDEIEDPTFIPIFLRFA